MTRTLKQQLGMEPIDDAPEHFQVGGNRLTKIVTKGGHEVDSSQPGLPTYHRRIGNPYPLFAIALGGSFIHLGALLSNVRGLQGTNIWLTTALPLSGIGGLTALNWSMAEGNTFLATASGSFAGIVGGISLSFIPWTGIQNSYIIAAEGNVQIGVLALYNALSIVFLCSFVPVFIIFLASVRTAVPVALSSLLLAIILLLSGVNYKSFPQVMTQHAAGALSFIVGILLMISALSVLLAEEGISIIPVMPLPRLD